MNQNFEPLSSCNNTEAFIKYNDIMIQLLALQRVITVSEHDKHLDVQTCSACKDCCCRYVYNFDPFLAFSGCNIFLTFLMYEEIVSL